jgi:hypothetical protein
MCTLHVRYMYAMCMLHVCLQAPSHEEHSIGLDGTGTDPNYISPPWAVRKVSLDYMELDDIVTYHLFRF